MCGLNLPLVSIDRVGAGARKDRDSNFLLRVDASSRMFDMQPHRTGPVALHMEVRADMTGTMIAARLPADLALQLEAHRFHLSCVIGKRVSTRAVLEQAVRTYLSKPPADELEVDRIQNKDRV